MLCPLLFHLDTRMRTLLPGHHSEGQSITGPRFAHGETPADSLRVGAVLVPKVRRGRRGGHSSRDPMSTPSERLHHSFADMS